MTYDLSTLDNERIIRMAAAGDIVEECHRVLAKTGDNIVGELLKGSETFYQMNHYPEGDVYDHDTHSQYYYHAHRPDEHGHFHLFLRPKGMPEDLSPKKVDDFEEPKQVNDALSHLIAVSMDQYGIAQALFTTNRWVTAEYWYDAEQVIQMLDHFEIDHASPSWPVNMWIGAIVQLFHPQICDLIRQRDVAVQGWDGDYVYEDRKLEITSELAVDAFEQIERVRGEAKRRGL